MRSQYLRAFENAKTQFTGGPCRDRTYDPLIKREWVIEAQRLIFKVNPAPAFPKKLGSKFQRNITYCNM